MTTTPSGSSRPLEYEDSFRNKKSKIHEQHAKFWSDSHAVADVRAYLNDMTDHTYKQFGENENKARKKWVDPANIFRNPRDKQFASNDNAIIIGNSRSFAMAQYPGNPGQPGMSMIHLLGISRAPIFNGVSLNHSNVEIIDEIIKLFKTHWSKNCFRQAVIQHQLDTIIQQEKEQLQELEKKDTKKDNDEERRIAIEKGSQIARLQFEEMKTKAFEIMEDDFQFGLHLWDDQSISHLHVHIIAAPWELRKHSSFENDEKTVDALELRDYIKSVSRDHPSNLLAETRRDCKSPKI